MKKILELVSKLPSVHAVHDKVTAMYNAWLSFYALLHKLGLATGAQLTPGQAAQVLNAEFAAGAARAADSLPVVPLAPADAPPAPALVSLS